MAEMDMPDSSKMGDFFGPGGVDQHIRQAIQYCWMMMPPEKKTPQQVEAAVRHLVDRALKDLREDAAIFGFDLQK